MHFPLSGFHLIVLSFIGASLFIFILGDVLIGSKFICTNHNWQFDFTNDEACGKHCAAAIGAFVFNEG